LGGSKLQATNNPSDAIPLNAMGARVMGAKWRNAAGHQHLEFSRVVEELRIHNSRNFKIRIASASGGSAALTG
jgi:hypothetical protein